MSWWQWWILANIVLPVVYGLMRSRQKRRETYNAVFTA